MKEILSMGLLDFMQEATEAAEELNEEQKQMNKIREKMARKNRRGGNK